MAVTSPDNIRTPDSGDQYALVQDLGVLADTTQATFIKRANLYVGTAAQRTAFTTATNGMNWQDTDGTAARYVRVAGAWVMQGDRAYSGTALQRAAFTTAPAGSTWQDTDAPFKSYWRKGSTWEPEITEGTITPAAGSTITIQALTRDSAGYVTGLAKIQRGTWTSGASAASIPVGFRPNAAVDIPGTQSGIGAPGFQFGQVSAAGEILFYGTMPAANSYCTVSFFYKAA